MRRVGDQDPIAGTRPCQRARQDLILARLSWLHSPVHLAVSPAWPVASHWVCAVRPRRACDLLPGLAVKRVKVQQKPVPALSPQQVKDLITAASEYPTLRLRVLLAVTTGLRRGDIQAIRVGDIHFDRSAITTQNRKAGKAMAERPIPEEVMTELSNHVTRLPDGQETLFGDRFSPKLWKNDVCTNIDPVLRQAISQLPVAEWV